MLGVYLDFEAIYTESRQAQMRSGKELFYAGAVADLRLDAKNNSSDSSDGSNKSRVFAKINEKASRSQFDTSIVFDEQGGLYEYICSCAVDNVDGPCNHIVALALASEDKFDDVLSQPVQANLPLSKIARTDSDVFVFSSIYAKRRVASARDDSNGKKVVLTPILAIDSAGRAYMRFYVARGRQYVIKDIGDFVASHQKASRKRFGQDLEYNTTIEAYDELSKQILEFLIDAHTERQKNKNDFLNGLGLSNAQSSNNNLVTRADALPLTANDADTLFEILDARLIELEQNFSRAGMRHIVRGCDNLPLSVVVTEGDGGFYISTSLPLGTKLSGKKFAYYVTERGIYRFTRKLEHSALGFLQMLLSKGKIFTLYSDMPLLYNNVLLAIAQYVNIDAKNIDLTTFAAAPLKAKLKLSLDEKEGICGELFASYDDSELDIYEQGQNNDIVRDIEKENLLKSAIEQYFDSPQDLKIKDQKSIFKFLKEGLRALGLFAEIELDARLSQIKVRRAPSIKVGVRLKGGLLDTKLIADGYTDVDIKLMLKHQKQGFVRLADGTYIDLTAQSLGSLSDFFTLTGQDISGELVMPLSYAPFLYNEFNTDDSVEFEADQDLVSLVEKIKELNEDKVIVPSGLAGVMRSYQVSGLNWLNALTELDFCGILADEMGTGKSLQIISLLLSKKVKGEIGKSIIICPTSLILNWQGEFKKFAGSNLNVAAIYGSAPEREALARVALDNDTTDVLITSYELLRRDFGLYSGFNFEFAVIDEAQYIKNPTTSNARAVKSLTAKHRFALTGTPIENSLSELWSIFDFLMPGYLLSYSRFKSEFEQAVVAGNEATISKLKKLVAPFILRRLKSDVLTELPSKIETTITAPLEGQQQDLYQSLLAEFRVQAKEFGIDAKRKIDVLSLLMRLRQIACDPRLAYGDYNGNSEKFEASIELVQQSIAGGHKVLLFSQFTSMIELFKERFVKEGIAHYILKGDTKKGDRMEMVDSFNKGNADVFLISLKAGGTGLNLTGADVVIHYDPWWNEAVTNQATDRAHRLGQDKVVQVYKMVTKGTVEERMLELAQKKSALSKLVLGGSLEKLKMEELLEVLLG